MIIDSIGIALTYLLTIFALWMFKLPGFDYMRALMILPIIVVYKLLIYFLFKLYNLILVNVGLDEVLKIIVVVSFSNLLIIMVTLLIPNFEFINEIIVLFTTLLELAFLIS